MAVAVRLIEALTLITMLGVLMASTIIVVIADRIFGLIMFILWVCIALFNEKKEEHCLLLFIFAANLLDNINMHCLC